MNNNSNIKYWNDNEETQLINEINDLMDINNILKNHNRKITGILIRIEKILNDPIKSIKIFNKEKIVDKYLANTKNKYFTNYEELYLNILNFNSLEEISNNYNKLSITKIKSILNDFLKKKDIDLAKKLRIKCLLKSKDDLDLAEKIFNKENNLLDNKINTDLNSSNTNSNINSIIIMLLEEIKTIRTDIFDIKNRVKIIMDKVIVFDKNNTGSKINNSKNNFGFENKINLEILENNKDNENVINNENLNEKSKDKKNKDKKIKIIMVNDNDNNNKLKSINDLSDDNISESNNDELDKEFKKMLC
jgi:hypothetical protein